MKRILFLYLLLCCSLLSHATTWLITSSNNQFTPDSITIVYGDSVLFQLDSLNNAQEVSYSTWLANDSTPITGFNTPDSGGLVTGLSAGTHYYVSNAGARIGMKGQIVVLPPAVVHFTTIAATVNESGSPVAVIIEVDNLSPDTASFIAQQDTNGATARFNVDYAFSQQLIFSPPGTTFDTVYLIPIDDEIIGPPKIAKLDLNTFSSNTVPGMDSIFTLTIIDNDTLYVSFLGAAFSYLKSNDTAYVGVTLSSVVAGTTSVTVVLDSGNAVKGVDFECADTTFLTFPADSIDTLYIPVLLYQDSMATGNLQINFRLIDPTNGALLGISGYTLFLIDNDDTATGIAPLDLSTELELFPNPARNFLNVQTGMNLSDVAVLDLYGREIMFTGTLPKGVGRLDVSQLPAGIYFLKGKAQGYTLTKRFIIQ